MTKNKTYQHLKAMLVKPEFTDKNLQDFIRRDIPFNSYNIATQHNIEGKVFIKNAKENRPQWSSFLDNITGSELEQLKNRSSSAAILIRVNKNIYAFTFGYGKSMLNTAYFVQDFGIKTALNSLKADSLRSIDTHTLEEQPIQKKAQSARGAEASVFGIDISRDILRSVTGDPRNNIKFKNISGADSTYSFSLHMEINDLPNIAADILDLYNLTSYKSSFAWVDNIRRVNDDTKINKLNSKLLTAVKNKDKNIIITVPEIIPLDEVSGFSFTRSKNKISNTIEEQDYLNHIRIDKVSIRSIKEDRLFTQTINGDCNEYSVFKCIYYEIQTNEISHILFNGIWYEVDNSFMKSINATLDQIQLTSINFPSVETWKEDNKEKIESEEDYNIRASQQLGFYLLDRKLIKSDKTTSPIELCDLLTPNHQLIHVKHSKAGSAGFSHLFAQGTVSAKVLKGDKKFRVQARAKLRKIEPSIVSLIPLDRLKEINYEVIFLILGKEHSTVKDKLPFFSKINLTRAYDELTQSGYSVKIAGVSKTERHTP